MTVGEDLDAQRLLSAAMGARAAAEQAQERARECTIDYVDAALAAGWNWPRIGACLGIGDRSAKNYYHRNRRRVHGGNLG